MYQCSHFGNTLLQALKNPLLEQVSNIWAMRDSNPRHPRCKRGALPTELIAHNRSWTFYRISRELWLMVLSRKKPPVFTEKSFQQTMRSPRGVSSAGRALQSHCRGQGFEFPTLHHLQQSNRFSRHVREGQSIRRVPISIRTKQTTPILAKTQIRLASPLKLKVVFQDCRFCCECADIFRAISENPCSFTFQEELAISILRSESVSQFG
jgi:hypothetical protein